MAQQVREFNNWQRQANNSGKVLAQMILDVGLRSIYPHNTDCQQASKRRCVSQNDLMESGRRSQPVGRSNAYHLLGNLYSNDAQTVATPGTKASCPLKIYTQKIKRQRNMLSRRRYALDGIGWHSCIYTT